MNVDYFSCPALDQGLQPISFVNEQGLGCLSARPHVEHHHGFLALSNVQNHCLDIMVKESSPLIISMPFYFIPYLFSMSKIPPSNETESQSGHTYGFFKCSCQAIEESEWVDDLLSLKSSLSFTVSWKLHYTKINVRDG